MLRRIDFPCLRIRRMKYSVRVIRNGLINAGRRSMFHHYRSCVEDVGDRIDYEEINKIDDKARDEIKSSRPLPCSFSGGKTVH